MVSKSLANSWSTSIPCLSMAVFMLSISLFNALHSSLFSISAASIRPLFVFDRGAFVFAGFIECFFSSLLLS